MAYRASSAAYDMRPEPYVLQPAAPAAAPAPRLDVVPGTGRQADQAVSPVFLHVVKVLCTLALVFCAVGLVRVSVASATAAVLNGNAELVSSLETAQGQSSDLEVMHSVYGSTTRIRDLAAGYGMVEPEGSTTLDFSDDAATAPASDASAAAAARATE